MHEETCTINCTDNDRSIEVDVLNFVPETYLDVSVNRQVKLSMHYDKQHKIYVGSMSGLEFTTTGPAQINYRERIR